MEIYCALILEGFDFCRVLHPVNKHSKNVTTVKWKCLSPDFHEQFVYSTSASDLAKQSLYVTVWDREKGRPDEYIGSMRL